MSEYIDVIYEYDLEDDEVGTMCFCLIQACGNKGCGIHWLVN